MYLSLSISTLIDLYVFKECAYIYIRYMLRQQWGPELLTPLNGYGVILVSFCTSRMYSL